MSEINDRKISVDWKRRMAVMVLLFWSALAVFVVDTNAAGEFTILHSPDSLIFSESGKTLESLLKEVISACFGLSVDENIEWKGLNVVDPFSTPEAVVQIHIDGVPSLGENIGPNTKSFPLIVDEHEPNIYEAVKHRIKQKFTTGGNKLVNIKLSDPNEFTSQNFKNIFGEVKIPKVSKQPLVHMKYSIEEDYQFLNEIEALKAITQRVRAGSIVPDYIVDFYNFRFRSLHALSDFHGPNSPQTKEAKKLLGEALQEMSKAFTIAYDESVLVTAIVTAVAHTRRAIRSPQDEEDPDSNPPVEDEPPESGGDDDGGPGDNFDANFPALFNLMLWFGLAYAFTLVAIVYFMMDMDPGRDSVIYRMTGIRMKKEM